MEFDLLIGQPIKRLIHEGQKGKLNVNLRKNFNLSLPITHSLNAETELSPEQDPMDEVMVATLFDLTEPNLEEDAQHFIQEEDEEPQEHEPLDETQEPPKPPIVLKPLPSGLKYAFLNNDRVSPVIISDKLSQDETLR